MTGIDPIACFFISFEYFASVCADLCYADDFTGDGKSTYYYAAVEGAGYIKPRLQVLEYPTQGPQRLLWFTDGGLECLPPN